MPYLSGPGSGKGDGTWATQRTHLRMSELECAAALPQMIAIHRLRDRYWNG